ncbi:MAG: hypothetical protein ACK5HU_02140, partial [Flavobacteriales bacterium]
MNMIRNVNIAASVIVACLFWTCRPKSESTVENKGIETVMPKEMVKRVNELVQKHWVRAKDVWPEADYTKNHLVVYTLDDASKPIKADIMRVGHKIEEADLDVLLQSNKVPKPWGFAISEYKGEKGVAISLDKETGYVYAPEGLEHPDKLGMSQKEYDDYVNYITKNIIFTLPTHEIFHFYYQDSRKEESRSTQLPLDFKSRYYRKMTLNYLKKAFEENLENKKETLSKAKFWYDKYVTEYSEEAKISRTYDLYEGTARYAEVLISFIHDTMTTKEVNEAVT